MDWDELCDVSPDDASDLISRLLIEETNERLGSNGCQEVSPFSKTFILFLYMLYSFLVYVV